MRRRLFVAAALAVTAGGAFAYATYRYVQHPPVQTVEVPTQPVVVAAADLSIGTELAAQDVRVVNWPAGAVPAGAFARVEEVVGRGLVAPVVRHEPILAAKLAAKEAGAGLPAVIPPGLRAVSVRVNEVVGVAGYVLPGTRVDVVATASPTSSPADVASKVVLANVQVLTAGTRMEQDHDRGKPMPVTVVTLLVTPEQAERLALATAEGKIQLALRNPLDTGTPETPGVRPAVLLGAARGGPAPRPAARPAARPASASPADPPAPPPTVEIIRGVERNREVVR